jgi:RecA/RadA recombinase
MSDELTRLELEAMKNALNKMAREAPPNDVPIPFTEKGCRRVGQIISEVATGTGENAKKQKPKETSE